MKIPSLKRVYLFPTGTAKTVVQGIARGINHSNVELPDIARPDAKKQPLQMPEKELLSIAVQAYMGRVSALVMEWLHAIKTQNTPAACVVVYGNRVYEDALIELEDILIQCGCNITASSEKIFADTS